MKNILTLLLVLSISSVMVAQSISTQDSLSIEVKPDSYWWGGVIMDGYKMPFGNAYKVDYRNNNFGNQVQPLMLSSEGEVIWSEEPYSINYTKEKLSVSGNSAVLQYHKAGQTLKEAYNFASATYFPPSGKMPDELLFSQPQYNTWIELVYNQNQKDVMTYARNILANGLPAGVLMIDDTWQENYGNWNFHPGKFPHPKEMIDSLHGMGFKVMVWVCPFVSADSYIYRDLMEKKYFITDDEGFPKIVRWWNGSSALLDLTNPKASEWFKAQLNKLTDDFHVDGFKLDAGDFQYYFNANSFKLGATPTDHCEAFARIGLDYPLNEYRAMWKMGGQPLAQRLFDKMHGFEELQYLIPNMLVEGLNGYYFSCPDMIGGGNFMSFINNENLDQESIVRSAQCHALMPMMQFSVAPWRVLDNKHFEALKLAVEIREKFKGYILELAKKASTTGEPIMKPLEFNYPNKGYATIIDQFMLGDKLLVAPVLVKGAVKRKVIIPEGIWKSFNGQMITGPQTIEIKVQLNDLPYFEKMN